jgi:protoporphyrinogen oxidase
MKSFLVQFYLLTSSSLATLTHAASTRVGVIGGGLSGLTAAMELEKLGYSVTVLEADDRVGGKILSIALDEVALASQLLNLTETQQEAKIELCGDQEFMELGAIVTNSGSGILQLADELGVPYGLVTDPSSIIIVSFNGQTLTMTIDEYLPFVAQQIYPDATTQDEVFSVIQQEFANYQQVLATFPEILTDRLDGSSSDLAMPMNDFAATHGIAALIKSVEPVVTGLGYGNYYSGVPAASAMKFARIVLAREDLYGFPCGFGSIPRAMAATLQDVRLNAPVSDVSLQENGTITVQALGQDMMVFDYLVISTTLDLIPGFMDVSTTKQDLFGRMKSLRYISTIVDTQGVPSDDGNYYVDQTDEANINGLASLVFGRDADTQLENGYQVVDRNITTEEAFALLKEDLSSYWNATATDLLIQKDWINYYPTVPSEDFANGYFDTMEELQGEDNIFYVGGQFSFETTPATYAFAKELIARKFEAVMVDDDDTSSATTPWATQVTTAAICFGGSLAGLLV